METKEYIVTLHNADDLDQFYFDMENPGGPSSTPDRSVDLVARRSLSRSTHYLLTDDEAATLSQDPRVLSVELTLKERGIEPSPLGFQYSNAWDKKTFSKSSSYPIAPETPWSNQKNWGLLRSTEGVNRSNWGDDQTDSVSGSIDFDGVVGRNVDVVIVDGHFNPNHPEFAKNIDGSGGSRVIQYNWFQHNIGVPGMPSTYVYEPYVWPSDVKNGTGANSNDNHGAHVAGTVAGNTQGWARGANIYNLSPYGTNPNTTMKNEYIFDYIRAFHAAKPINPFTGRKNPTICNCSWGFGYSTLFTSTDLVSVNFRGITYSGPFFPSDQDRIFKTYGVPGNYYSFLTPPTWWLSFPLKVASIETDIADAIKDGIIVVAAAGNENRKADKPGDTDYNNYLEFNPNTGYGSLYSYIFGGTKIYYHRGSTPGSTPGVISVGAISNLADDRTATFTNHGTRIDVFAPGDAIMSSVNSPYGFRDSSPISFVTSTNITSTVDYGYSSGIVSIQIKKNASAATGWNTGARANSYLDPSGGLCFVVDQRTGTLAAGLTTDTTTNYTSLATLDYGFYIKSSGAYDFIESGAVIPINNSYTTSTLFEVEFTGSEILYKTDRTVQRRKSVSISSPFRGAVRINTPDSSAKFVSEYISILDPRNKNYYLDKIRGTSMASPQVTGVLACILENYPNYTQTNCVSYLTSVSKTNQITDYPSSDFTTVSALRGAPNRYLYFTNEKPKYRDVQPQQTAVFTKSLESTRKSTGMTFPRPQIRRK